MKGSNMHSAFTRLARSTSRIAGQPQTFGLCVLIIIIWACLGPIFHFSDTWQLVINTSTTIITFLMVFLIQSTQNRDAEAMQLKLDELIRALKGAQNSLIDLEDQDVDLDKVHEHYQKLADVARAAADRRSRKAAQTPEEKALSESKSPKKK